MNTFLANESGRVILIHLTEGEDVLKSIETAAKRAKIQTGIVSVGIGSLRKAVYHYINATSNKPDDTYKTIERPMELVSLQGIILEGKPHLHAMMSEAGSICHSGHMEEGCEVQYLVETSIQEVKNLAVGRRAGQYGTVTHFEWLGEPGAQNEQI